MKKRFIIGMTAAALALTACGSVSENSGSDNSSKKNKSGSASVTPVAADESTQKVKAESSEEFNKGAANFSAEMFKQIMAENGNENVLVSPESVLMCMGMVANGAESETLDELTKTLCGGNLDTLNAGAKEWAAHQNDPEYADLFKISNANSAWINDLEGFNIKQDYVNRVSDVFGAEIMLTPFSSSTVDDMNNWCKDKTDGMIPQLIDDLPDSSKLVLINAITFEAQWDETYDDYQCVDGNFNAADGSVRDVTMLTSIEDTYVEDGSATGFVKYYNGGYAFMALLPNEGVSVSDYAASMTGESLTALYENRSNEYDVTCNLPEFNYDYSKDLNGTLANMGINRAFDEEAAQFGGMTSDTDLYINKVVHKTHIELDRNGTKAAAATAALMVDGAIMLEDKEQKEVILDRPFIYAIIDTHNDLPVFIGCVNDCGE